MKRGILIAVAVAALFGLPMAAKAVVIGTNTMAADGTLGAGWTMSEIKGSSITDLSTTLNNVASAVFFRRGNALYFPRITGIAKQIIGSSTSSLVKKTSSFVTVTALKTTFVVSDTSTAKTAKGSYLFDVSSKKVTRFTPKIGKLTQAQIAPNGKWLAILTKNSKNKPLLYVSALGALEKLTAVPLPKSATSCTAIAIAPNNASLALVCTFTQTGGTTATGIVLGTYANGKVQLSTKPYYDDAYSTSAIVWVTSQKLVSAGFGVSAGAGSIARMLLSQGLSAHLQSTSLFTSAIHAYTVNNRKVTKLTVREVDTSTISTDPNTLFVPLQIRKVDANTVMFMSFIMASDAQGQLTGITTYIGSYNLLTSTHNILLNNGKVNILGDSPVIPG